MPRSAGKLRNAAGTFAVVAVYLVLRANYLLPIETRLPSTLSLQISNLHRGSVIVEQSNYEAHRWCLIATRKGA